MLKVIVTKAPLITIIKNRFEKQPILQPVQDYVTMSMICTCKYVLFRHLIAGSQDPINATLHLPNELVYTPYVSLMALWHKINGASSFSFVGFKRLLLITMVETIISCVIFNGLHGEWCIELKGWFEL